MVVIEAAESMPAEAQNSLLKLLEEPPQGVLFILLAHDSSQILSTISSRCVNIGVLPVSLAQARAFYKDTSDDFARLYRLSGGQTGLLYELINNDEHPLVASIEAAKQLLSASPYDRLKQIESDYKNRDAASAIVKALLRVCTAGLQSGRATTRWIHNCRATLETLRLLEANVQTKLVLDQLFLNLR